ncbi:MAG: hypothetical protein Q9186_002824 [Xanthomendoza sp. 1 TL-2023]
MVKGDPKCDYYADLELPPSADANEIKRQFKKLGLTPEFQHFIKSLKYHPDRNPGKELEFNSKFQAIQAAHEVLTDPTQKAKYDADRIKNGLLHPYTTPLRPNPPPRAAASNFPPPPQRTPQASNRYNFTPQPSSASNRYSAYMRTDPNNPSKSPADDAKARANAFKAWEQMRHGQGVPPQARPVPPRPTKNTTFQPAREAGSYPPKEPPQRPPWDQTKEPHPGLPKMARSNTTRVPKKGGFAPGFSAGDEPPARNTSAYFNVSKGERPDVSRSNFESRPAPPPPPPPPPPPAASNQRSSQRRPDPLKPFRPQSGAEDLFANSERLSTPYATSGGEKTYFGPGFGRPTSAREAASSGDVYDSEPFGSKSPNTQKTSTTSQRGHHSASPKLRSPRPVSVSSTSSSSSDESLREGVEELYTSAAQSRGPQSRTQNGRLKPSSRPYVSVDNAEEDKGLPPRSRSDAAENTSRFGLKPPSTGPNIDAGQAEGFMEHRMKHEAERTHGADGSSHAPPHTNSGNQSKQRLLHRPRSWHDKYGVADQDQAKDNVDRPATGDQPVKPSMYDASGFDPFFFPPSTEAWSHQWPFGGSRALAAARSPRAPLPHWAIPSCIPPRSQHAAQTRTSIHIQTQIPFISPLVEDADKLCHSFTFPYEARKQAVHPPPLRSHSSDTISVNFSPSDWHGKFTGRPGEYFDPPMRKNNVPRGRNSPTKRPAAPANQTQPAPSVQGSEVPMESSHMPPPPPPHPPGATQEESYSPDKWAPYFKPGTLNWPPPPPPPQVGAPARGPSRKRPKTPSRRGSRNVVKRPAVPKPVSVTPVVDDAFQEMTSSNVESASSQSSASGTPMDLDMGSSPPSGPSLAHLSPPVDRADSRSTTPRPPIPPRANVPPRKPTPQDHAHLGLDDLRKVAPFAPNEEGIKDLNDLSTALPFESKASAQPPKVASPQQLALPQPPKAPVAPELVTQSSWERYIAAMHTYIIGWNAFNTQILAHFNERQASAEATLKPDWKAAMEKWGVGKYMQGVEEDFRVREHWDISWERHRECMRVLGAVREKALGHSLRGNVN